MILESLIEDESMLTLDCAKARISKGQKVEIKDKHWHSPEVQGAIALGVVRLVGEAPDVAKPEESKPDPESEPKKKFVSRSETRMAFECDTKFKDDQTGDPVKWKDYVDKGGILWVPESAVEDRQIQNALGWGLLVDPDAKPGREADKGDGIPVDLQEATVNESDTPSRRRRARPKAGAKSAIKAKPISSAADADQGGDDDEMFRPSSVIDTQAPSPRGPAPQAPTQSDDDFLDLSQPDGGDTVGDETPDDNSDDFGGSFQELFGFDLDDSTESK